MSALLAQSHSCFLCKYKLTVLSCCKPCIVLQVAALHLVDRHRGNVDTLLRAIADGLPTKALPLTIQLISHHMQPLASRYLSAHRRFAQPRVLNTRQAQKSMDLTKT